MTANSSSPIPPIGPTTGQAPSAAASRFKPIDPLRVLRQYLVLLIIAGLVGIGIGVGTYFVWRHYAPSWTSSAQLFANPGSQQIQEVNLSPASNMAEDALERYIHTEINRLLQEDVLRNALQRDVAQNTDFVQAIKRKAESRNKNWLVMAREKLEEDILEARMVPGTALMQVSASTPIEGDAPRLLNAVIEVYMSQLERSISNESTGLRSVFSRERELASQEINQLQQQRADFRTENNLATLQQAHSEAGIEYREAAERRAQLEAALSQAQATLQSMQQQQRQGNLTPSPSEMAELERLRPIQTRIERLAQLNETLEVQKLQYGENHRVVEETERRIAAVEAEKKRLMNEMLRKKRSAELEEARQNVESFKSQLSKTQQSLQNAAARLTDLGNQLNRYQSLEQQIEAARQRREQAVESLNNLRMQQGGGMPMQVRTPPSSPELTSPDMKVVIGGVPILVVGLVTGLVFLRELLDQRMRTPADVSLLQDGEVLGVLPDTDEDPSGRRPIERVVEKHPTGLMAECFRQLRTAVLSKMDRRGYKTLMVVGPQPDCGTSSVAQNLAMSLAHNGRRVLVIDCNFRQPQQHTLLGLPNDRGLVDVLQDQASLESVITPIEGSGVSVLPTGEASHAQPELLEGQAFRSTLSRLEADYDFVIIDTPPALLTSEARMLAKHVDALAAVVRATREKRGMVDRMLRQLDGQRADILGIVLNGVKTSAGGYFRKSYQAFYRYSANGGNGRQKSRREADKAEQVPAGRA
jgi:capsular exopolysaccharide synthesis family protein